MKNKNEHRDVACKDSNCFVLHVSFFLGKQRMKLT